MRILVVEDDKRVAGFICKGLREESFAVDLAETGEDALELVRDHSYDFVILDLMLPGIGGHEVLQKLRADGIQVPVLILTARDKVQDKVLELRSGADDYLTKPFAYEELLARIQALLRRKRSLEERVLKVADLELDPASRSILRSGIKIELTNREYAILELLMRNANRVITRTVLMEHVWERGFDTFSNVIDVHMARLRRKIDDPFPQKLIKTLRGTGYLLQIPEAA